MEDDRIVIGCSSLRMPPRNIRSHPQNVVCRQSPVRTVAPVLPGPARPEILSSSCLPVSFAAPGYR
jgi:hypothetical protein